MNRQNSERKRPTVYEFLNSGFGLWLCATLLVPLIGFTYAQVQKTIDADRIALEAKRAQAVANAQLVHEWVPEITSDRPKSARVAAVVLTHLAKNGSLDQGLNHAVTEIIGEAYSAGTAQDATPQERAVADAIAKVADPSSAAVGPASAPAAAAPAAVRPSAPLAVQLAPRVYIQIPDNALRQRARELEGQLEAAAIQVPGIEYVPAASPDRTQVRYYLADDRNAAKKVADIARQSGFADVAVVKLADKYASRVRPGHFELWIGKNALRL
ncbi:MAG TPA: hypothetical protein VF727_09535 [Allosphingosinicella sp.]|jgi:hypothetical protein